MNTFTRNLLVCLAPLAIGLFCISCGGSDSADGAAEATGSSTASGEAATGEVESGSDASAESASVVEAFRKMAASEGIYIGEVPEGFPLDILPLYPDGEIDKSSVTEKDFSLLQVVPGDKDTVFAWYEKHFGKFGWSANDPITVIDRTMVGFQGKGGKVDMTLMDREEGKTFVALVLSPR